MFPVHFTSFFRFQSATVSSCSAATSESSPNPPLSRSHRLRHSLTATGSASCLRFCSLTAVTDTKAPQMPKSVSSDSLDSLFDDGKDAEIASRPIDVHPKEEAILLNDIDHGKRDSLLMMNFSAKDVDFAIGKLDVSL